MAARVRQIVQLTDCLYMLPPYLQVLIEGALAGDIAWGRLEDDMRGYGGAHDIAQGGAHHSPQGSANDGAHHGASAEERLRELFREFSFQVRLTHVIIRACDSPYM